MKMTPYPTALNHTDKAARNAVIIGNIFVESAIRDNRLNLRISELCHAMTLAFRHFFQALSIRHIFQSSAPIQVRNVVVGLVTVAMTNLSPARAFTKKSRCDKAMHVITNLLALAGKSHRRIAFLAEVWSNELRWQAAHAFRPIGNFACKRPNSPQIRDFIFSFKASDWLPFFHTWKLAYVARLGKQLPWKNYP